MRIYRDKEINEIVAGLTAMGVEGRRQMMNNLNYHILIPLDEYDRMKSIIDAAQVLIMVNGPLDPYDGEWIALADALAVVDGEHEPEQVKQVWWNADIHAA